MATIYTRAAKGSALTWTEGDANITNLNNDKIEAVVDDTTPQLGGNLDVNTHSIVSTANGNISITPNGTGSVVIDGNAMPQDSGIADQVLITDGAGQTSWSVVKTIHSLVYNADSVTINKGDVVYLFGAQGANPSVKLALNTSDATSAKTYGVANENIAAGATGEVVTQGLIKNVNTAAYASGDTLYLGATAGSVTTTKPYGANHLVYVGLVTTVNSVSGRILVRIQNGYELDELHRVDIDHTQALASADYLTYNGTTGLWQNAPLAIEDDTAPVLGGNLDVNGKSIVSAANGNIVITPNGTGSIVLDGQNWPQSDGTNGQVLKTNGAGQLSWGTDNTGVTVTDDTSTNATRYITFEDVTSGTSTGVGVSSTKLTFNPSTGRLTTTAISISGSLSSNNAGNGVVFRDGSTGILSIDTALTYNPVTDILTAAGFSGPINGTVGATTPNTGAFTTLTFKDTRESPYSLGTTSGTIAPDVANGSVQTITLNGNLTLNAFTNPIAGQSLTLIINTNGAGRTLTSTMKFAGGSKTLSTTNTTDIISVFYDGTNYWASLAKDFV